MLSSRFLLLLGFVFTAVAQQPMYAQCGGIGWTGGTACVSGAVCTKLNDYYSQCLPGSGSSTTAPPSSSTNTTTSKPGTSTTSTSASPSGTATTPNMSPEWQAAYTKARAAVAKLSLSDKVNLGTGIGWMKGACVGNTPSISSISFPGLCLEDSPLGVRSADLVSAFPAGINAAATFNRTLIRQRGQALGQEFKGKGVNVALGPDMNIARAPAAGRNWEGFGGDPYLSGESAFETITGIQSQGVQACAKHYINNEQEHFRDSSSSVYCKSVGPLLWISFKFRYLKEHEVYAYPFLRSVQANVASVMCSYNRINGTYACENSKVLNNLLKSEFGFPGYVMSDWWATHSTSPAVNGGLDMTMPGKAPEFNASSITEDIILGDISANSGTTYFGQNLINAVNSGSVPQSRIDDMATRILAAWYLVGQNSGYPSTNFNAWNTGAGQHVNVQGNHKELIRSIDAASTVLLKNTNNVLPLRAPKTVAVIGNGAGPSSRGPNGYSDRSGDDGVLAMGWGSGTAEFPYLIDPLSAIKTRAQADGSTVTSSLSDTDLSGAASAAGGKDVALVFITADSGEGYLTVEGNAGDRNDLKAWHNGDALVNRVASANSRTIVVVNSVGAIDMESWVNNPNVTAIVWSGLPGQEAGNGLVDVLYGNYNPSGRLPYTIGKSVTDYGAQVLYNSNGSPPQISYSEGIFVDYKFFDKNNVEPRFPFGFGLSYTTFQYSGLTVTGSVGSGSAETGPGSSLDPWLHEDVITVSFTLQNNGTVAGHEIPQLYTAPPAAANAAPRI
ncbi:hypothetical protein D9756_003946 [Leucocoprinus leucothites]|uniref:beta-glucosidase n=1 Tax=Leucocoprinus leucothites TaxID=201217 RepID=A0A8H5D9L5_9AGAR|nr:hypothetical protein D9756_003946 [Leucoagaricus leucothites]